MLTLIEGAEIHSPAPLGQQDLLVARHQVAPILERLARGMAWAGGLLDCLLPSRQCR